MATALRDRVFISYSHKDKKPWLERLETMLAPLVRQGRLSVWADTAIAPGDKWRREIEEGLARARVTVLLVSPDFLASRFIAEHELPPLLEAAEREGVRILPVLLKECLWRETELAQYQFAFLTDKPLAKLRGADRDEALTRVAEAILAAAKPPSGQASSEPPAKVFQVPHERNPFFTGREDVLDEIAGRLKGRGRVAFSALGGMGKTQCAIEHAYRHRDEYDAVLWSLADSRESLTSGFAALAGALRLPAAQEQDQTRAVAALKGWLEANGGYLLILDNADDPALLPEFLPAHIRGHLLITTRAHALGGLAECIEVGRMTPEEGALLLLRRSRILASDAPLDAASDRDRKAALRLVEELGGLPLALDQAGAYLEETGCGLEAYRSIYRSHRAELLARRGGLQAPHPDPVAVTWQASFEKVEQASPAAGELLRLCAFLHPDAIPEEVFSLGAGELGEVLGPAAADPFELNNALAEALRFSLLRRMPESHAVEMHRLVQAVIRDGMDDGMRRSWAERVVRAVNGGFPYIQFSDWPLCERLLPQAQAAALLIEEFGLALPEAARLLNQAAYYLKERARYAEAEPLYRRALAICEQVLGPEHPHTALSLNNLALLYHAQGRYAEAEPLYRRALAICEQALGPEHPDTATVLENYAALLRATGRDAEAADMEARAQAIRARQAQR